MCDNALQSFKRVKKTSTAASGSAKKKSRTGAWGGGGGGSNLLVCCSHYSAIQASNSANRSAALERTQMSLPDSAPGVSVHGEQANFTGLVLGCIEAKLIL